MQNDCFYRSTNVISGKIGRIASEEVTLQLINGKMHANLTVWSWMFFCS